MEGTLRACGKDLRLCFASLGGLVNAYKKDLCLPVEMTYDRLWKGLFVRVLPL